MTDRTAARDRWVEGTVAFQRELCDRGERRDPPEPADALARAWEAIVPFTERYHDFHRQPLRHQLRAFYAYRDRPFHALWWEQRCRKTGVELNVFRYRYELGHVRCLIVLAYPNGVHRVWADELAKDWPPDLVRRTHLVVWRAGIAKTLTGKRFLNTAATHDGPVVACLNAEAINTKDGWRYLTWLRDRFPCMIVADEASWASRWSARTERLLHLGGTFSTRAAPHPNVVVKAALDGTPADEGPGDLFYPTTFLARGLLGARTNEEFKDRYFEYETTVEVVTVVDPETGETRLEERETTGFKRWDTGAEYRKLRGYRNLDELRRHLARFSSRVLRADVADAPAKTYQTRYFDLTKRQREAYEELRDRYTVDLRRGAIAVTDVLTRLTRLQMVARNYWPPERYGAVCDACVERPGRTAADDECPVCEGLGYVVALSELERIDDRSPARRR